MTYVIHSYNTSLTYVIHSYNTSLTYFIHSYNTSLTYVIHSYNTSLAYVIHSYNTSLAYVIHSYHTSLAYVINSYNNSVVVSCPAASPSDGTELHQIRPNLEQIYDSGLCTLKALYIIASTILTVQHSKHNRCSRSMTCWTTSSFRSSFISSCLALLQYLFYPVADPGG